MVISVFTAILSSPFLLLLYVLFVLQARGQALGYYGIDQAVPLFILGSVLGVSALSVCLSGCLAVHLLK